MQILQVIKKKGKLAGSLIFMKAADLVIRMLHSRSQDHGFNLQVGSTLSSWTKHFLPSLQSTQL